MPVKHAEARNWREVKASPDGIRYSAWPRGNRPEVNSTFAMQFPSNVSATDTSAPYAVIEFANPHQNGLRMWGAGNTAGVTVIRKVQSIQQNGYYAMFWYSRTDGQFDGANVAYWGAHPYPVRGYDVTNSGDHIHEVASGGFDSIDSSGTNWSAGMNSGYPPTLTNGTINVHGQTYLQGLRITRNGASSKTLKYYFDLPSVANAERCDLTVTATNYGETDLTSGQAPKITIGDSPWYAAFQHERASCVLDSIKIFSSVLSESDMLLEAADFTSIITSAGQSSIWWGRNGFDAGHDVNGASILCHYGTGRAFTVVNPSTETQHQIQLVGRL